PASAHLLGPELSFTADLPSGRIDARRSLLQQIERGLHRLDDSPVLAHDHQRRQAYDLLRSPKARSAFDLDRESAAVRERYGRGGLVHGASDKHAAYPKDGTVLPSDLTATIFHCLGYKPDTEIRDALGRPHPISRGRVLRQIM